MRKVTGVLLLLIAVVVVVLSGRSASARQRVVWEYHIAYSDAVGGLNKLGQEGWEAVAVYRDSKGSAQVLMKRRQN